MVADYPCPSGIVKRKNPTEVTKVSIGWAFFSCLPENEGHPWYRGGLALLAPETRSGAWETASRARSRAHPATA
jgi:hypothetical protein